MAADVMVGRRYSLPLADGIHQYEGENNKKSGKKSRRFANKNV